MDIVGTIIGVGSGVTIVGVLIAVISFISNRPKRSEVQEMIESSISAVNKSIDSMTKAIDDVKDTQQVTHKMIQGLSERLGKSCENISALTQSVSDLKDRLP